MAVTSMMVDMLKKCRCPDDNVKRYQVRRHHDPENHTRNGRETTVTSGVSHCGRHFLEIVDAIKEAAAADEEVLFLTFFTMEATYVLISSHSRHAVNSRLTRWYSPAKNIPIPTLSSATPNIPQNL